MDTFNLSWAWRMFNQEDLIACVSALRELLPLAEARAQALTQESEADPKALNLRRQADEAAIATLNARTAVSAVLWQRTA